ncbi:MAG: patatin-like protein [Bradyrhizobiaceae bacterium]|nr:patatin-like protein [Hyphomicrobiales bacterium]MBV9428018.1 patatin-like protein [Bradyrhizobiaceae bacterium]
MREKELRIALVCFGGVSLAVYMHGISKEILKLVRASAALHAITDREARAKASFFDGVDPSDPEYDTEAIYFDLLREIGARVELRVVVDIIAGASAGGINGAMLARALSHDLPMGKLRDLWLDNGDVSVLLAPEAKANRWSKAFLKPLIWGAGKTGVLGVDREVRDKLSLFVRSRWFKPPLSGARMAELMFDAATAMGAPRRPGGSLLPSGQRLDLMVMLTDYHGYQHQIQIHDPPLIRDREHHHVLRFSCRRNGNACASDFALTNAPALAFAARATSSFPGAFPPAQIREMDALVERRGTDWPDRAAFIARNFAGHIQAGIDPATASFIDGSVLNNRPFHAAIAAIHGRPAYRQIDRRLVYIDPDPASAAAPARREAPGFFATLKGAMSDIPRNQPVTDELGWIFAFNDEVRQLNAIIDGARPSIHRLLARIIADPLEKPASADQIRAWREQANAHVAQDAGFAYQGYVRLKLASVRRFLARLIAEIREVPPRSPLARLIAEIIDAWASDAGLVYSERESAATAPAAAAPIPDWASFLLAFDVDYRKRRLNFLIEGQNRLYQMVEHPRFKGLAPAVIDRLKRDFYGCLELVQRREDVRSFDADTRALAAEIFAAAPSEADARDLRRHARRFAAANAERLGTLIARLAARIDLTASTRDLDVLLAGLDAARWPAEARREVLINYLGFPFWDVLAFPLTSTREVGELHEILVDRISPQDARSLDGFNSAQTLKGIGFGHFAAFLSRAYRENDYLLGRLHAIDRLIDIVCDSARIDAAHEGIDVVRLKQRAFSRVLDAEAPHLSESAELIAALRRRVADMGQADIYPGRHSGAPRSGEPGTHEHRTTESVREENDRRVARDEAFR